MIKIKISLLKKRPVIYTIIMTILFSLILFSSVFTQSVKSDNQRNYEEGKFKEPAVADDSVLRIIQATPWGDLTVSDSGKEIYVMFNHPLVPVAMLENETKGVFSVTPYVKGKFRWYGSRICSFKPDNLWETGIDYKITIPAGLKSVNDKTLKNEYTFSFNIIAPELDVSINSTGSYSSEIDYDQAIMLRFNFPVRIEDLYKHLSIKSGIFKSYEFIITPVKKNQGQASVDDSSNEKRGVEDVIEGTKAFIVKATNPFKRNSEVTVAVKKGIKSENKISKLMENSEVTFKTHGPLKLKFEIEGTVYQKFWRSGFSFSNKVDVITAANAIKFSPHAAFKGNTYDKEETRIGIYRWDIKPGVEYKITVSKFKDIYGNTLDEKGEFTIKVPDYAPEYYLESDMNLIEAESGHKLPVELTNIQKFDVSYGSFNIADLQAKLDANRYDFKLLDRLQLKNFTWETGFAKNTEGRAGFDISNFLTNGKYGWLAFRFKAGVVDTWDNNYSEKITDQIIQSTNLSIAIKEDYNKYYFWVNTLSGVESKSGINIEIYDKKDKIESGITDAKGYCEITKKTPGINSEVIFFASDKNGDMAYLTSKDNDVSMYGLADYSEWATTRIVRGQIIFDRKLYRPGDRIFFKGVLAEKNGSTMKPFAGENVDVSISNSEGENVYSQKIKSSENGGVWGDYTIPADAKLGHYNVSISTKVNSISDTFQVEEFRPVSFSVDIKGGRNARSGENVVLTIEGKYLFGAPMSQAPVSYSISRARKSIDFENFSGFTFGDNLYWFNEESNQSGTGYYSGTEGKLTAAGRFAVNVDLKPMKLVETLNKPDVKYTMSDPYDINIEATVRDVDIKSVTGHESFSVFPGDFMIGIKSYNSYQSFKDEFKFDIVAATNTGGAISGKKAELRVIKNTWKTVHTKGPEGSLQVKNTLEKEIVYRKDITLSNEPQTIKYRPADSGVYTVTVQEKNGMSYSRTGFYAYGGGYGSWGYNDDDSITMIPDKTSYNPGDTAKILVQSPYKNCKAIITLERESIYWQKTVTLDGKGTPVEIPIKDEYTPNVYLSIMLIRPRINLEADAPDDVKRNFMQNDLGAPRFKAGMTRINISTKSRNAKLDIVADKPSYSPGEKIKLKIYSEPGAEIAISVADRGVLDLINYMFANPVDKFYSYYPLGVRIFHNMSLIIKQYKYAMKGEKPGGGGDDYSGEGSGGFAFGNEDGTRNDIRYTAYWNPQIVADKNGFAEVEFKLPDNLTTFRVMALASAGGKYREFKKEFKVRKAMVIQKSVPRFIRCGDKLMIGAVVINQTGISGKFKVSAEGDLLNFEASSKIETIAAGEAKEVLFPVSVNTRKYSALKTSIVNDIRNGKKDINKIISNRGYLTVEPEKMKKFSKAGFEVRDVKDKLFYEFPVKEHPIEEAFTVTGFTDSSSSEMIKIPSNSDIHPEFGGLDIKLSNTALIGLQKGFTFYESNPYFCLEQRASAFLLAMTSGKLLKEFSMRPPDKSSYDFDVIEQLFLGELKDFRNADGGFRLWKESGKDQKSNPYLTAYINFVLVTAKSRGYKVDDEILAGAITFLKDYMKEPEMEGYSYILETFSFINYTFSVGGLKDQFLTKTLMEKKNLLSTRAKGFLVLSAALQRGVKNYTEDTEIKSILDSFKNNMEISTGKVSFKDSSEGAYMRAFYTEGSTLGVILLSMIRLDRDNPVIPSIVNYIISSRDHHYWEDTQSIALIALALDEYQNTYEKTGGKVSEVNAKVILNSHELLQKLFPLDTRGAYSSSVTYDTLYTLGKSGINLPLEFKKEGKDGRLYYSTTMQYQPVVNTKVTPRDEGFEVRRTLYDLSTATDKNIYGNEIKDNLIRGEVYLCKITVVNSKSYYNAVIVDPLPSNVEILNSSFATEKKNNIGAESGRSREYDYDYDYWYGSSNRVTEYRDDKVVITEEYLYSGMHEYIYLVRPVSKGEAKIPAASAKLMYSPEVFGRTGSSFLNVQ